MSFDAGRIGIIPYFRYRILSLFKAKQEIEIELFDATILVRTATPDLCVALSSVSEYEILSKVLPKHYSGLIIDAGAYIGTSAIALAKMYPRAAVICIEPSRENFAVLERNIAPFKNIACIKGALGGKKRKSAKLANRGTGPWGYTIVDGPLDNLTARFLEDVDIVTLDSLKYQFPDRQIGLLKLDIEGGERDLLLEAADALRDIPVIYAELHDRIVHGCSQTFEEFSADRWLVKGNGEKLLSLSKLGEQ